MAEKINATCAICGKGYHMCISCKDMITLTPWKKHTDTSEHYKVYQIIHGYSTGVYTKAEAKRKFDMVDLSDVESFRDNIKSLVKDIISVDKPATVISGSAKKTQSRKFKPAVSDSHTKTSETQKGLDAEE